MAKDRSRAGRAGRFLRRKSVEGLAAIGRPVVRAGTAAQRFGAGFLGQRGATPAQPAAPGAPMTPGEENAIDLGPRPPTGHTQQGIGVGSQQAQDHATLQRATREALPFFGEAMQVAGGEQPTATETPPLRGVSQVGNARFLPGTAAGDIPGRNVGAEASGQIGPSAPSFLDRTRQNAARFGLSRSDFGKDETVRGITGHEVPIQLEADRRLQIREARTLEDKQALRNQFRQEDRSFAEGGQQRAAGVAGAEATAQGATQKGVPAANINAATRQAVAEGKDITSTVNTIIKAGKGQDAIGNTIPYTAEEALAIRDQVSTTMQTQQGAGPDVAGADLNNDGEVSKDEQEYNTISSVLAAHGKTMDAAKRDRLKKRLGELKPTVIGA